MLVSSEIIDLVVILHIVRKLQGSLSKNIFDSFNQNTRKVISSGEFLQKDLKIFLKNVYYSFFTHHHFIFSIFKILTHHCEIRSPQGT